jgi:hypothetical protein
MKIKDILSGWKNYIIDDPAIEAMAKQRAKICSTCPQAKEGKFTAVLKDYRIHEIEGLYCGKCLCPLSAKVRSENETCPLNKWQSKK